MTLKLLRALGFIMLVSFGFLFVIYLFLFPLIGTWLSMAAILDYMESKGIKRSDLAVFPVVVLTMAVQSFLSFHAIRFFIHFRGFK